MTSTFKAWGIAAALLGYSLAGGMGPAGAQETEPVSLKVAWSTPPSHGASAWMRQFVDEVGKANVGIQIESYPDGQLFNDAKMLRGVMDGTVDIGITTIGRLTEYAPSADVFDLPFLFPDTAAVDHALRAVMTDYVNEEMQSRNIKVLGWQFSGPIDLLITRDKDIKTVADVAGLKLRAYSPLSSELVKALGGQSTVVASSEVYLALQQGVFDGVITNGPNGAIPWKWYEVATHATFVPLTHTVFSIEINTASWQKLSPDRQKALLDAADKAQIASLELANKTAAGGPEALKAAAPDISISFIPQEDWPKWEAAAQPVYDAYLARAGERGNAILDRIRQLK